MDDHSETDDSWCKLKFSSKLNKKPPVFITEFSNGNLNSDISFECYRSQQDDDHNCSRHLVATTPRLSYAGQNSGSQGEPFRTFVGVLDKATGRMKMYDSVFFRMKPLLNYPVASSATATPGAKSYREGRDELTSNFGSKMKKRSLNARLKYTVTDAEDETIAAEIRVATPNASSSIVGTPGSVDYLPPVNRDAKAVEEVFDVSDFISLEEDYALNSEITSLSLQDYPAYISERFESMSHDPTRVNYILYLHYLMRFQRLNYTDIRKRDPDPLIGQPFKNKFIETFTISSKAESGKSSRNFPLHMKDKLLAYIIVLALHIDGFAVNADSLQKELNKVGMPKLINVAQAIGCHIVTRKVKDTATKFIVLTLPLTVLEPKQKRRSNSKVI